MAAVLKHTHGSVWAGVLGLQTYIIAYRLQEEIISVVELNLSGLK